MWLKTIGATPVGGPSRSNSLFAALAAGAVLLVAAGTAGSAQLDVGNILTFSTGSTAGNPQGTWTLDDKSFTFLDQSGFIMTGTGGPELIRIIDSQSGNFHSFSLQGLGTLAYSGTYTLGYRVDVVPTSPYSLKTVALDTIHLVDTTRVYKDVFSSFSLFSAASGSFGGGDLAALYSLDGVPDGPDPLAGALPKHVWVRDTIILDATGEIDSVSNTYTQTIVPEIDPTSFAPVIALVVGGLACSERRRRLPAAV